MRLDRIKFAAELARAEITLTVLAERSGVSRATVTAVRSGKSCSRITAEKIAAGLGVDVEQLKQKYDKDADRITEAN